MRCRTIYAKLSGGFGGRFPRHRGPSREASKLTHNQVSVSDPNLPSRASAAVVVSTVCCENHDSTVVKVQCWCSLPLPRALPCSRNKAGLTPGPGASVSLSFQLCEPALSIQQCGSSRISEKLLFWYPLPTAMLFSQGIPYTKRCNTKQRNSVPPCAVSPERVAFISVFLRSA